MENAAELKDKLFNKRESIFNNISDEEVEVFINNLSKCSIREFTLEQLVKQHMEPELMFKRELGIYE